MEYSSNRIILRGSLAGSPVFSHENHGRRFFRFPLEVPRLSGTTDTLQVMAPQELMESAQVGDGDMVEVTGQIRSFNSRAATGRRLVVSVYAESLTACEGEPHNEVYLAGTLCKEPVHRKTPLGREICDVMLAVNRPYHRSDYIPCIFWGRTAELVAACQVGDTLELTGRLQSREYVKVLESGNERRVAYEVSAMTAARTGL